MHYLSGYPELPAARDRFIVDLRTQRPAHDPWRFQDLALEDEVTERGDTARVGTIFLTGRECPWRCAMCDLWRFTTHSDTPAGAIPAQIAAARRIWRDSGEPVARIKLYNASNFFDPRSVPEADYKAIADELSGTNRVTVESHPSLIGRRVEMFRSRLRDQSLEVAMGLETVHPGALDALNKRMTTADFARAAAWLRERDISVRTFVLIYPPFVPMDAQDDWLIRSVEFAESCGASVISLVPTRGGNGAMEALARQGLFRPPTAADAQCAFELVMRNRVQRATSSEPRATSNEPRILLDPWSADAN